VIDNEEEALAIRVDHVHRQGWGAVKLMKCGYKVWEQTIKVEEGMSTTLKPVLEKQ